MPEVTIDFRKADEGGANFTRVAAGNYRIKCVVSKVQKNQSGPGNVIWTEWRVMAPDNVGAKILQVFSLEPQAAFNVRNMMMAISGKHVPTSMLKIRTESFLNMECGAFVGDDEFKSKRSGKMIKSSKIQEWMSLADYEALRKPSRNGAPSVKEAVAEADAFDVDDRESEDGDSKEQFEYDDPEDEDDEKEEAEEFSL